MIIELSIIIWAGGGMADTGDLKSPGRDIVRVRVPPRLQENKMKNEYVFCVHLLTKA